MSVAAVRKWVSNLANARVEAFDRWVQSAPTSPMRRFLREASTQRGASTPKRHLEPDAFEEMRHYGTGASLVQCAVT